MIIEIRNDLNVDEYNNLREEVGWKIKNSILVEKAIYDNNSWNG